MQLCLFVRHIHTQIWLQSLVSAKVTFTFADIVERGKKQSSCIMEEGVLHMNNLSAVEVLKVQPSLTSLHCASTSAHTSLIGTLILGCITLLSQLQVPLLVGQRSRCRTHPVARH